MLSMVTLIDFMGREITEGAVLVYPVRKSAGKWLWLKKLTVRRVVEREGADGIETYVVGDNEQGRQVNLFKTERSVIVEV